MSWVTVAGQRSRCSLWTVYFHFIISHVSGSRYKLQEDIVIM